MSSRSHQTYTRRWANLLKVPIFCIDYRKAPQYPYPCALDDCWQAYNWIINYVDKFFDVIPKRIVLVGDSAGGNLITALTLRCIKHGVRLPDGIMPIYPGLFFIEKLCNIIFFIDKLLAVIFFIDKLPFVIFFIDKLPNIIFFIEKLCNIIFFNEKSSNIIFFNEK